MQRRFYWQLPAPSRQFFIRAARICAGIVITAGLVGLSGWLFNISLFRNLIAGSATMKVNTALCFILSGLTLWLLTLPESTPGYRTAIRWLIVVPLIISGLTLSEYILNVNIGIDELLLADPATAESNFPGRMSPATALNFAIITSAFLLLAQRRRYRAGQALVTLVVFGSLLATMGYLFGRDSLYSIFLFSTMALHTAIAFLLLGLGTLAATSDKGFVAIFNEDGPGGLLARWLLPTTIFAPVILGWLIRTGAQFSAYDLSITFDLLVLSSMLVFTVLISAVALAIRRADIARSQAEEALIRLNRAYHVLSECNQTLVRANDEGHLLSQICAHITDAGDYVAAWYGTALDLTGTVEPAFAVTRPRLLTPNPLIVRPDPSCVQSLIEQAVRTSAPQVMRLLSNQPAPCLEEAARLGYESIIALPVQNSGNTYGVLCVYSRSTEGFNPDEIQLLNELAGDLGYGITTLRLRTARQAAEDRAHYQASLLENVSDAVIATDLNFVIHSWNKAAETIYGRAEKDVIGHPIATILRTEAIDGSLDDMLQALKKVGNWHGEVWQSHRDGHQIRVMASVSYIYDTNHNPTGVVAVNRDITEYAALKDRLVQHELEHFEYEKERELLTLKEQFIAMVSHDFRSPLAVILTSSDMMQRYEGRLQREQRLEHLSRIHQQAEYMALLLEDVLSLSKAQAGRIDYQPEQIDLKKLCQQIFEQAQLNATEQHQFTFSTLGALDAAHLDSRVLQRILINLLSNAVKYSPAGGQVMFEIERQDDIVRFRISDTGIGIPKNDLKRIFDPFHRADNTRDFQGTGLGMSIVRENVLLLGGQIVVNSVEGEGTSIIMHLPYHLEQLPDTPE
ncbi:MAG: hypothetical protein CL610_23390 [Anaerolineaceae bacterium]|nr:hypothetical protein [Anaerolineaceae bacterium]